MNSPGPQSPKTLSVDDGGSRTESGQREGLVKGLEERLETLLKVTESGDDSSTLPVGDGPTMIKTDSNA